MARTPRAAAAPKPTDAEMEVKKYKVIGEIFPVDPETGENLEEALEIDSIQEVPAGLGDGWVEAGLAELVVDAPEENNTPPAPPTETKPNVPPTPPEPSTKATEAVVMRDKAVVRTYSLAVHGKGFAKLAETYVSSRAGLKVVLR